MRRFRLHPSDLLLLVLFLPLALAVAAQSAIVTGSFNQFAWQAEAWLNGRVDVSAPLQDLARVGWRSYVPFPPFPSVVLLPFVAVLGRDATPSIWIGCALALVSGVFLFVASRRLGLSKRQSVWLSAGMIGGTGVAGCCARGEAVWFFAQLVSFCALGALVCECVGKRRGWLLGLCLGLSFLSRQMTLLAIIVPLVALNDRPNAGRHLVAFVSVLALCVGVYLGYNAIRFGHPLDTGYSRMELTGMLRDRFQLYGLFHPAYLPSNLLRLLVLGPTMDFAPPLYLRPRAMDSHGTALTIASPFVLLSFVARAASPDERRQAIAAIVSVFAILIPTLFYYNDGWTQVGAQRFTLDFLPLLLPLIALGLRRCPDAIFRALILWSIALNGLSLYGVWFWNEMATGR